jgi:hypothetical protein
VETRNFLRRKVRTWRISSTLLCMLRHSLGQTKHPQGIYLWLQRLSRRLSLQPR